MQKEEKIRTHEEIDNKKAKNLYNALVKDQKKCFLCNRQSYKQFDLKSKDIIIS